MQYPVLKIVDDLREKLRTNGVCIVSAPPGAGKSTVLPLELLDEPWLSGKKIIMLEPRRLATRSVAKRMATILQQEVGETIGYRIRFETAVGPLTRIEVVTEGILTRMIQQDNALSEVGMVIFDEFHERSLHADIALALSLQVQQVLRPDLKIMLMSATLDTAKLSALLGQAPALISEGRQFPVAVHYDPSGKDYPDINYVVRAVRKALHEHFGDILVFLPGAGEIVRTAEALDGAVDAVVYPLYGDLPFKKQQEAIMPLPSGQRKIVLATSIAETSLTIEGIGVVIDSGFTRVPRFDPRSGFTRLQTIRVTRDAADQRAGRAGRLGPGVCIRLWSESVHANLVPARVPEILEADLAPVMLELFAWGIRNVNELTWITPPPNGAVSQAVELLQQLEAVEGDKITTRGKAMLRLPTHPRIAHMLMEASTTDARDVTAATDLASLLEEKDPLGKQAGADLSLRVDILRQWRKGQRVNAEVPTLDRIERLAQSWRKLMKVNRDDEHVADTVVGRLLVAAYPERVARLVDKNAGRYKLANGRVAKLPDHDPLLKETWIAVADLDAGMGEGKIFLAAPLDEADVISMSSEREAVRWDAERGMIVGVTEKFLGSLPVTTKPLSKIPDDQRINVLLKVVRDEGLKMLGWDEPHQAWQARVMSLRSWRPDDGWPDVSDAGLLASLESWLAPFLGPVYKAADFHRLDLMAMLATLIPWELSSRLDKLAPTRIEVPTGSMIRVQYFANGQSPVMEVRLQELFGLADTPTVNDGRTKVLLHLLSPGYKPVQVTQDLRSFWNTTYAEVRKELRTRYPKHAWPDDPWTAEPVRGARRRK